MPRVLPIANHRVLSHYESDPLLLTVVAYDTKDGPEHALYDERTADLPAIGDGHRTGVAC